MSYEVRGTPDFEKAVKNLLKKHKSILKDLAPLIKSLKEDPKQGAHLKNNCYKIRLAISSKNKGKSGGARVITYVRVLKERVLLIDIYDKSDRESISENELEQLINNLPDELLE